MKKLKMKFPVTCKTGEVVNNYRQYLKTNHWQDVRKRFRESKYKKECNICGDGSVPLDLHHKTYKRLGNEYLMDLIYLCREHHQKTHTVYKNKTGTRDNLWNAHKRMKKRYKRL